MTRPWMKVAPRAVIVMSMLFVPEVRSTSLPVAPRDHDAVMDEVRTSVVTHQISFRDGDGERRGPDFGNEQHRHHDDGPGRDLHPGPRHRLPFRRLHNNANVGFSPSSDQDSLSISWENQSSDFTGFYRMPIRVPTPTATGSATAGTRPGPTASAGQHFHRLERESDRARLLPRSEMRRHRGYRHAGRGVEISVFDPQTGIRSMSSAPEGSGLASSSFRFSAEPTV